METIKVRIKGAALLMHNVRLSNPLDPVTKRMKSMTGLKKKTDDNLLEIMNVEFEGGLYHDEVIGPFIPAAWLDSAIREGATVQKNGKKVTQGVMVLEDKVPLQYSGPRDIPGLLADPRFRDVRSVRVMASRNMRCRPKFSDWAAEFTVQFDPQCIDRRDLEAAIHAAGQYKGIGDYRPGSPKGGRFGRFEAEIAA